MLLPSSLSSLCCLFHVPLGNKEVLNLIELPSYLPLWGWRSVLKQLQRYKRLICEGQLLHAGSRWRRRPKWRPADVSSSSRGAFSLGSLINPIEAERWSRCFCSLNLKLKLQFNSGCSLDKLMTYSEASWDHTMSATRCYRCRIRSWSFLLVHITFISSLISPWTIISCINSVLLQPSTLLDLSFKPDGDSNFNCDIPARHLRIRRAGSITRQPRKPLSKTKYPHPQTGSQTKNL